MLTKTFRTLLFPSVGVLMVLASGATLAMSRDPGMLFIECHVWNTGTAKQQTTGFTKEQLVWLAGWLEGFDEGASGTRTIDELVAFVNQFCATYPDDTLFSATRAFNGSGLPLTDGVSILPASLRSLLDQFSPVNRKHPPRTAAG